MNKPQAIESVEIQIVRNGEVYPVEVDVFSCKFDMDGFAELEMSAFGYCKDECFQLETWEAELAEMKAIDNVPQTLKERNFYRQANRMIEAQKETK